MKHLGNLAIICARRPEVLMQVYAGQVTVYTGTGPDRAALSAAWDDDPAISRIVQELNFGKYREPIGRKDVAA